tara:strand:- start:535 stop:1152 length:618 start_codon:yes stop_codon:yes gene_type:complete
MSKIIVNQIESSDGTTDVLNSLSAVSVAGDGMGQVMQTVVHSITGKDSINHATHQQIISAAIVPKSTSSVIKIEGYITAAHSNSYSGLIYLMKNGDYTGSGGTLIGGGRTNDLSNTVDNVLINFRVTQQYSPENLYFVHYDEPSTTSSTIYQIRGNSSGGTGNTLYINHGYTATANYSYNSSAITTISITELNGDNVTLPPDALT